MQGISRLEQFVEELSEEERAKELKQEKKRQKRKNRRKNKCGFDISEQEAEDKEKNLDEVILHQQRGSGTLISPCILFKMSVFICTYTSVLLYLHLAHLACCRVLLSLLTLARSVVATMRRRKRPDVMTSLQPVEALPVFVQTTPNRVKIHTDSGSPFQIVKVATYYVEAKIRPLTASHMLWCWCLLDLLA